MQVRVRRSVIEALPTPSPLIITQLLLRGIFMVSMFFVVMMSTGTLLVLGVIVMVVVVMIMIEIMIVL